MTAMTVCIFFINNIYRKRVRMNFWGPEIPKKAPRQGRHKPSNTPTTRTLYNHADADERGVTGTALRSNAMCLQVNFLILLANWLLSSHRCSKIVFWILFLYPNPKPLTVFSFPTFKIIITSSWPFRSPSFSCRSAPFRSG